jgi:type IV secretory pathway VirB2 component (pilin)
MAIEYIIALSGIITLGILVLFPNYLNMFSEKSLGFLKQFLIIFGISCIFFCSHLAVVLTGIFLILCGWFTITIKRI